MRENCRLVEARERKIIDWWMLIHENSYNDRCPCETRIRGAREWQYIVNGASRPHMKTIA